MKTLWMRLLYNRYYPKCANCGARKPRERMLTVSRKPGNVTFVCHSKELYHGPFEAPTIVTK
jgi:hypothetical protein